MEKIEGRTAKRKRIKRKQQIILIGLIVVLSILILTIVVKAFADKNTRQVVGSIKDNVINNSEDIKNDTLIVEIESNIIEENNIPEENTNEVEKNEIENNETKNTSGTRYRLEVNCEQNVVNVYEKDENGEYTNCVKAMLCSVGPATPTSGTYSLKKYGGWEWKGLFGNVYGQYATQITGNILFHSVPYTSPNGDKSTLEYWEYDKLGTPASMGCVRLTVRNAKWIYDNCASGTKVMFYNDANPGPLGKPTENKISSEEKYRGWDPTDPDSNNPWKNYGQETPPANEENETIENIENNNQEKDVNNQINDIVANNEVSNNEILNDEIQNNEASNNEAENDITNNTKINNTVISDVKDNIINNSEGYNNY